MKFWYVIQTKPKREEEASQYLTMKGLDIFFPLMERYSAKSGRMQRGCRPLFPSYIFGNFSFEEDYTLVRWAKGVKKILGVQNQPLAVAEEVIGEIRKRIDEGGVVKMERKFEPNEPVRITSGPFRDFHGVFEEWIPEKERVRILLNLIGYQPKVEVHFSMVEKAN